MASVLASQHPMYAKYMDIWNRMIDAYEGSDTIKSKTVTYLPPTASMEFDGLTNANDPGAKAYKNYRMRAVYPDLVKEGVEGMRGMVHREAAQITLPEQLEGLRASATRDGQNLQQLLEQITEAQLKVGRLGILADWPTDAASGTLPYIVTYNHTQILNWDEAPICNEEGRSALGLVVLDESGDVRVGLEWKAQTQYRILALQCVADAITEGASVTTSEDTDPDLNDHDSRGHDSSYVYAVVTGDSSLRAEDFNQIKGVGDIQEVLFEFINPCDTAMEPDSPPLIGLADMCLTIYRGDADYRQSLFMNSQDTLVVKGKQKARITEGSRSSEVSDTGDIRTGTGAVINVGADGDAKYIGVESQGLPEQRKSIENDYARAGAMGAKLMENAQGGQESGEALSIRVSSRTATLPTIANAGAYALESLLKKIARAVGANPDEVKVTPNKDYTALPGNPLSFLQLSQAKALGMPLSWVTIHDYARRNDVTRMSYEDEQKEILKEPTPENLGNGPGTGDPSGDPDS